MSRFARLMTAWSLLLALTAANAADKPAAGDEMAYIGGGGVELCPALPYHLAGFKLKAAGAAYGYGYNLHLSRRRAFRVMQYLMDAFQIPRERIIVHWYGRLNPVADNATPEGRQQNRRVELVLRPIS